ncbi:MAG: putative metal-dependent hydrolase [Bacteroidetes bacterium]|nr:putative metal-dependent hydrolase [Bacteroidota bacterium]
MLKQEERKERIQRIGDLPSALERAVDQLTDAQLDTPYREGGWSVRQVVHHLADSHMNAYIRMKLTLTEDHPTVRPYDQEAWAEQYDAKHLPIDTSLKLLAALHARWYQMLTRVQEADWARTAFHPENGESTLETFLITYSDHGTNHVKQITDLRSLRKW